MATRILGRPTQAASEGEASGLEAELQKSRRIAIHCSTAWRGRRLSSKTLAVAPPKSSRIFATIATVDAIKSLLPVIDSFERALQAKSDPADFRAGVNLIYKQLQDALAKLGVSPIPAKGEQFDPHVHEAIEMVEASDVPDHEVLEELQRGYKFKDRLLRPAMVKVAKNSGNIGSAGLFVTIRSTCPIFCIRDERFI